VNWEGTANTASAAYIEVEAASEPKVGIIRVRIDDGDTAETLAARTAKEWNDRDPIAGIFALHQSGTNLAHFLHPYSEVKRMAVAFQGHPLADVQTGQKVTSSIGVSIERVEVDVTIQASPVGTAKTAKAAKSTITSPGKAKTIPASPARTP